MDRTHPNTPIVSHPRCPYCHEAVTPQEDKEPCRICMAWHHSACWNEHGACAACQHKPKGAALPVSLPDTSPDSDAPYLNQKNRRSSAWAPRSVGEAVLLLITFALLVALLAFLWSLWSAIFLGGG